MCVKGGCRGSRSFYPLHDCEFLLLRQSVGKEYLKPRMNLAKVPAFADRFALAFSFKYFSAVSSFSSSLYFFFGIVLTHFIRLLCLTKWGHFIAGGYLFRTSRPQPAKAITDSPSAAAVPHQRGFVYYLFLSFVLCCS